MYSNDPNALSGIGFWSEAGGLGISAISSFLSAMSARKNLKYQAKIAKLNAKNQEWMAQHELRRGQQQAALSSMGYGQLKGRQRAAMAANGVDLGYGSAAEVLTGTDIAKEVDTNTIIENATRAAWGHRMAGVNYLNEAGMANANAGQIVPALSMATSLLGGAGRVADRWYQYQRNANSQGMPMGLHGGYVYGQPTSYNAYIY